MKQKIKKISLRILIFLLVFLFGAYFAFNSEFVQQKLTRYLSNYLSDKWGTVVSVKRIYLELNQQIKIEDLYIEDLHRDTLLYVKELYADFTKLKLLKKKIVLKEVKIDRLKLYLKRYEGEENLNMQFILDSLGSDTTKKKSAAFKMQIDELALDQIHFIYHDQNIVDTSYGMQFQNLDISEVNGVFNDLTIINDSISFEVYHFSARDKSGLNLTNLQTKGYVSGTGLDLKPLYIRMNNSVIDADRLAFRYKQWAAYKDFNTKVKMLAEFKTAKILMNDIAYFAGSLEGWKQEFILSGTIKGKISNLSGKSVKLLTADNTFFQGDFNLDGLPDIKSTFITVMAERLETDGYDIEKIQTFPFHANNYLKAPDPVKAMGRIRFNGEFTGFVNDFVAYGSFKTNKGNIISDVSLKNLANDTIVITGNFKTEQLRLDVLLDNPSFGILNSRLNVKIKTRLSEFESAHMKGQISRMDFNGYKYKNITLNGLIKPDIFNGSLSINDPALLFDFNGKIEIAENIKDLDFEAQLYYADLGALHFLPIEKYSSLSGDFNWKAYGYAYDELIGNIEIANLSYCTDDNTKNFGTIYLETDTIASSKSINLISQELDVSIEGRYNFKDLAKDFKWQMSKIMPAMFEPDPGYQPVQSLNYDITFKDMSFLTELDIVDLDIEPGTYIHGVFDPAHNNANLSFYSDRITYNEIEISYPELFFEITGKDLFLEILADGLAFKESETSLNNSSIIVDGKNDTITTQIEWRRSDERFGSGTITTKVNSLSSYFIDFRNLNFKAIDNNWELDEHANIVIDSSFISFNDFHLNANSQSIWFNGKLSEDKNDTLDVIVKDFHLTNFNYILNQLDYSIGGISNGNISWIEQDQQFKLVSKLQVDSAIINDYYLGDISLESKKNKSDSAYQFQMSLLNDSFENLHVAGEFAPNSKSDEKIDFDVTFDDFDLGFINSLNVPGISKVSGTGNGLVNISGSFKDPQLNGRLDIKGGEVTVEIIGSHISFDTRIDFEKDFIGLDPFPIYDSKGDKGIAYGTILHDHLRDWNFNLDVEMENFESLNLKKSIDAMYYGKAYATGDFNISGYGDQIFITINAATAPNTEIYIPLDAANTITKQDLVTFITYDLEAEKIARLMEEKNRIKGVTMELNIKVKPNAKIYLVFDEVTGDILHVVADGLISLGLDKEGDFKMKGTLEVRSGEYFFSMEGIINKRFQIEPGSRITWFGDPYDADIDIKAIYYTRAALYPIMTIDQDQYRNRVNVELILQLKNKLLNPEIDFNIILPNSEERERTSLKNATLTSQDMNLQVVSLLLFGSFQPVNGANQSENFAAVTSYEMLSNQVSNILSNVSDDFDINFNYRPETSTSGQEIALGFSTQLLDNRLLISTDLGVRDNSIYGGDNVNNIIGDFVAEYKLTEDGRIWLKAFNRSNDYQSTTVLKKSPYTQGFGLVFRKELDRLLKGKSTQWDELQKKYDEQVKKTDAKNAKIADKKRAKNKSNINRQVDAKKPQDAHQ